MKVLYGSAVLVDYNIMFRKRMLFAGLHFRKIHLYISCVSPSYVRVKYGLALPGEESSVSGKKQE